MARIIVTPNKKAVLAFKLDQRRIKRRYELCFQVFGLFLFTTFAISITYNIVAISFGGLMQTESNSMHRFVVRSSDITVVDDHQETPESIAGSVETAPIAPVAQALGVNPKLLEQWTIVYENMEKARQETKYCVQACGNHCCGDAEGESTSGWRTGTSWVQVISDQLTQYASPSDSARDVTFVSMGSYDRLKIFNLVASRWPGPKVFVINLTLNEESLMQKNILEMAAAENWTNVKILTYTPDIENKQFSINTLRNLGVDHANTLYVFPADVDFLPSKALYQSMIENALPALGMIDRASLVIPHFETWPCGSFKAAKVNVPVDFASLHQALLSGTAQPFHAPVEKIEGLKDILPKHSKNCKDDQYTWTPGVMESNYGKWYELSTKGMQGFYKVTVDRGVGGPKYEPFTVVKRIEADGTYMPRAPELFYNRHNNKVAYVDTLKAAKYQFYVMLQEFAVHNWHARSKEKDDKQHLKAMDSLLYSARNAFRQNNAKMEKVELESSPFDEGYIF